MPHYVPPTAPPLYHMPQSPFPLHPPGYVFLSGPHSSPFSPAGHHGLSSHSTGSRTSLASAVLKLWTGCHTSTKARTQKRDHLHRCHGVDAASQAVGAFFGVNSFTSSCRQRRDTVGSEQRDGLDFLGGTTLSSRNHPSESSLESVLC